MAELFDFETPQYDDMVFRYETIEAVNITDTKYNFKFPDGNYYADCFYLNINMLNEFFDAIFTKYMQRKDRLSVGSLIDTIIIPDTFSSQISGSFIDAYTKIYNIKNSVYIPIPFLRLISVSHTGNHTIDFGHYGFEIDMKPCPYNLDIKISPILKIKHMLKYYFSHILQNVNGLNFNILPLEVVDTIVSYVQLESKVRLFYRKTMFFNNNPGEPIHPIPYDPIIINYRKAKIENNKDAIVDIYDLDNEFNYNKIVLVTNFCTNNKIEKVSIFKTICVGTISNKKCIYELTKEFAELYGETFEVQPNHYLLDVTKIINNYCRKSCNKISTNIDSVVELYKERLELYKQNPAKIVLLNKNKKFFDVELHMKFAKEDNGDIEVFMFK